MMLKYDVEVAKTQEIKNKLPTNSMLPGCVWMCLLRKKWVLVDDLIDFVEF